MQIQIWHTNLNDCRSSDWKNARVLSLHKRVMPAQMKAASGCFAK